jgi:hypothetical protein
VKPRDTIASEAASRHDWPVRALLVLVAACGGAQHGASPELAVRNAGAQPRRIVRLDIPAHADEHAELRLALADATSFTDTNLDSESHDVRLPELAISEHAQVTSALPDGSAWVRIAFEDARAGALADATLQPELDRATAFYRKHHITFRLLPDGSRTDVSGDRDVPPALDLDDKTLVTFPSTPIGVGAEWSVTRWVERNRVQWFVTYTYRLRALDDATATIDADVRAGAPSQTLARESTHSRSMRSNSLRLTDGTITGHSQLVIPLHALVPTGHAHVDTSAELQRVNYFGRTETKERISQTLQIAPR